MSTDAVAVIGFIALFVLMLLRVPVGMAMGLVGVSGFGYLVGGTPALKLVGQTSMRTVTDYTFGVIPMFLLMGTFVSNSGMSRELFRAAKWGVVPVPQQGRASLICAADLAQLLLALVPGGEDVTHQVFEPDDGRQGGWTHEELARAIGWAVGRRVWVPRLSRPILMYAAKLDGTFRRAKAKLTADRVSYICHPDWVCAKGKAPPGVRWRARTDTRERLKQTAQWYRAEGWL